jgi:hypothetical protein
MATLSCFVRVLLLAATLAFALEELGETTTFHAGVFQQSISVTE